MSNGQPQINDENEKEQEPQSFDEEKKQNTEPKSQNFDFIIEDINEKSSNEKQLSTRTTRRREQVRKRREKQISSDNFQDSDSIDDLDYTLENDIDFERKSRSSYGKSRYSRNSSNSRGFRSNNSSNGADSYSKSSQDGRGRSRRNYSGSGTAHSGWKPEEDARLREAIALYGSLDWMKISNFVGNGRTRSQCSQRWHRCLDPHISKEKWSEEEIETLKQLVNEYGDRSWARIASKMDKRCDVQCRYMYKRIIGKKSIRGLHSESDPHSKSDNTEKVDISGDEFENEIDNEENIVNSALNPQGNAPQSNIFLANQNDFSLHQTAFQPSMINNNPFPYQPQFMPFNPVCNNYAQNCNYAAKSMFPVSDNVFSLFDMQTYNRFNQQPFKLNQDQAPPVQSLPVQQQQQLQQQQNCDTKESDMQFIQFNDPVINKTPIDDIMAGLSTSSSSSFSSLRYKF